MDARIRPARPLTAALPRLSARAGEPPRVDLDGAEATPRFAWATVALLSLANFCSFFDRIILTFMFVPLQRDLHLSDTQLGILAGPAFALTYLLTSLPLGYGADRLNRKWMVTLALAAWSVMTLGSGLATSFVLLVLFRAGLGIGEAVIHPCASSMIGDMFGPRRRPVAFGIFFTSGASAVIVSFLLGGEIARWLSRFSTIALPVVGPVPAWRATLLASFAIGAVLVPFLVAFLREPVRGRVERRQGGVEAERFLGFIGRNRLVSFAITAGIPIANIGVYTFLAWITVFFQRVHHWPAAEAGIVFALTCGVAALAGTVLTGLLPGLLARAGVRAPTLPACLLIVVVVNGFGAAAMVVSSPTAAVALLTVAFLGFMSASVFALSMIGDVVPTQFRALFTALTIVGTALLTGGLGPVIVGVMTQHVFKNPNAIGLALCVVWLFSLIVGGGILAASRKSYRALAEATLGERRRAAGVATA